MRLNKLPILRERVWEIRREDENVENENENENENAKCEMRMRVPTVLNHFRNAGLGKVPKPMRM